MIPERWIMSNQSCWELQTPPEPAVGRMSSRPHWTRRRAAETSIERLRRYAWTGLVGVGTFSLAFPGHCLACYLPAFCPGSPSSQHTTDPPAVDSKLYFSLAYFAVDTSNVKKVVGFKKFQTDKIILIPYGYFIRKFRSNFISFKKSVFIYIYRNQRFQENEIECCAACTLFGS